MKTIYYLLLLVLGCGLLSCYDDKSTYDTKEIPNVELDLNGVSETQYVAYLGKLHIDIPVKKNGTPDHPDLEYKWEIELSSSTRLREVLSTERVLDTIAAMPIQASGYTLTLEVTDKVSTLKYYSVFSLVVESQFREGIIVAHSRDGVTSDLSLIMDKDITKGFAGTEKIQYDDIFTSKGEPLEDWIDQVAYTVSGATWSTYQNILWMAGKNGLFRADCRDYSFLKTGKIVPFVTETYTSGHFYLAPQTTILVMNNQVYQHLRQNDAIFIKPEVVSDLGGLQSNYVDNRVVAAATGDGTHSSGSTIWYDSQAGRFGRFNGAFSQNKCSLYSSSENDENFPFDPSAVAGKEAVAGGFMNGSSLAMVLKDKVSGEYSIYTFFTKNQDDMLVNPTPSYLYSVPAAIKDLLDRSVSICFSTVDPIMYVATAREIHAVRLNIDGSLSSSLKYTVAAGENISILKFYTQGRYNVNSDDFDSDTESLLILPLNTKAVMMATQASDSEGYVYLIPQKDPGTGNLDEGKQVKYDGFGKISDITAQGR